MNLTGLSLARVIEDGLLLSAGLGAVILGSLLVNARLWIHDAPEAVRARVAPLDAREKRQRAIVGALFFVVLLGVMAWSMGGMLQRSNGAASLVAVWLHAYGVFFVFNLFDLLVIDGLFVIVLGPKLFDMPEVPGMTWAQMTGGFGYHLRAFFKGLLVIAVPATIATGVTLLFARL